MKSWYEIKENTMGRFRGYLKKSDGGVLLETISFPTKEEVLAVVGELRVQCQRVENFACHMAMGGKNYFSINKGKQQIYRSWLYDSEPAREAAIDEIAELAGTDSVRFI